MPTLEQLLMSEPREAPPRPSAPETLRLLREAITAEDRPAPDFERGQHVRIKPDLHSGIYRDENPVYVFHSWLEHPVNPLDYVREVRELFSPAVLTERDCIVMGLDSDNEAVKLLVSSTWLEVAG